MELLSCHPFGACNFESGSWLFGRFVPLCFRMKCRRGGRDRRKVKVAKLANSSPNIIGMNIEGGGLGRACSTNAALGDTWLQNFNQKRN